jgi:hypothetical protein
MMTFLLGVNNANVGWPLAQFMSTEFNETDVYKLLGTINAALQPTGQALTEERLRRAFETNWPTLKRKIDPIIEQLSLPGMDAGPPERSDRSILEEILEIVRVQQRDSLVYIGDWEFGSASLRNYLSHGGREFWLAGGAPIGDRRRVLNTATVLKRELGRMPTVEELLVAIDADHMGVKRRRAMTAMVRDALTGLEVMAEAPDMTDEQLEKFLGIPLAEEHDQQE